jgi:hypothetical protein
MHIFIDSAENAIIRPRNFATRVKEWEEFSDKWNSMHSRTVHHGNARGARGGVLVDGGFLFAGERVS